ncbi:hypothetical protein DF047_27415 [Burkholderia cenocepacia]|nr:hypothetical protein DF047_27415 [Burkholderia cenocepacia]
MPDAHSIHEIGRIIRRASAMKNRCRRQIIIAKSAVSHIVAGQFHAAGSGPGTPRAGPRSMRAQRYLPR